MKSFYFRISLIFILGLSLCSILIACSNETNTPYDNKIDYMLNYELSNDGNYYVVTGIDKSVYNIVIPNDYNSLPVKEIGEGAFYCCTEIKSISIPNSVVKIGKNCVFSNSAELNEYNNALYLGDSINPYSILVRAKHNYITECEINLKARFILNGAFSFCKKLSVVSNLNSIEYIGDSAFDCCSNLQSIDLGNRLNSIGDFAFRSCQRIKSISLHNSLERIGNNAFNNCVNIANIYYNAPNIPDFGIHNGVFEKTGFSNKGIELVIGSKVLRIPSNIFSPSYDTNLYPKIINVSFENNSKCEDVGNSAFSGCKDLTVITFPDTIINIGYMAFYSCKSLKRITIPSTVKQIGSNAFYFCSSMESVTLTNGIEIIDDNAFANCVSITDILIPNSIKKIGSGAFSGLESLVSVQSNSQFYVVEDSVLYNTNKTELIVYPPRKANLSFIVPYPVTTISESAFNHCVNLTNITLPDSLLTIEDKSFLNCTALTAITIPLSVEVMGARAFYGCKSLDSFIVPNNVKSLGNMVFGNCTKLKNLVIGSAVSSIGKDILQNAGDIKTIVLKNTNGWRISKNYTFNDSIYLSSTELLDSNKLWTYFCSVAYEGYYWERI